MRSLWSRIGVVCCWVALGVCGCHEESPSERYPENLGDDNARLLPTGSLSHDESILDGRASVVDVGEVAPPPSQPREEEAAPSEGAEAKSTGFWGGLLGAMGGGAPESGSAPAAPPGRGGGAQPPAESAPSPEDEAAIRGVFNAYSTAFAEARFDEASQYLVSEQRAPEDAVAGAKQELCERLTEFQDEFGETASQAAGVASVLRAQLGQVGTLGPIRMVGSDQAVADVSSATPGAPPLPFTFTRTDGGWLLRNPMAITVDEGNTLAGLLRDVTTKLDELMDGLDAGELQDSAATGRLNEILTEFNTQAGPILQQALMRAGEQG